jgi:hypothetical protein
MERKETYIYGREKKKCSDEERNWIKKKKRVCIV